jgi:hypothetical protein
MNRSLFAARAGRRCLAGLCAGVLLCGCAQEEKRYSGLEFELSSAPPATVAVQPRHIGLPAGIAVKVSMRIQSSELPFERHDALVLRARDPEVLELFSAGDDRQIFFAGNDPGTTCLEVRVNGVLEDCIDVSVTSQQ